jgi:hypothetical protein
MQPSRVSIVSNLGGEEAAQSSTAIQAEVFRRNDESFPVEALVEETVRSLMKLLDFAPAEITHKAHTVVPHAYVISDVNRPAAVGVLHEWLKSRGIFPMGLFGKWKYVWSDVAYRDGEATAAEIQKIVG